MANEILGVIILILSTVGSTINITNIIGSFKSGILQKENNIFLANLMITDFMFTLVPFPVMGISQFTDYIKTNKLFCEVWGWTIVTTGWTSFIFTALIGYNRYMYICKSQQYPKIFTRKSQYYMCAIAWSISIISNSMALIPNNGYFSEIVYDDLLQVNANQ